LLIYPWSIIDPSLIRRWSIVDPSLIYLWHVLRYSAQTIVKWSPSRFSIVHFHPHSHIPSNTASPIRSDFFESSFERSRLRLIGLSSLKRCKRDLRSLAPSFRKSFQKCQSKWDRLYSDLQVVYFFLCDTLYMISVVNHDAAGQF